MSIINIICTIALLKPHIQTTLTTHWTLSIITITVTLSYFVLEILYTHNNNFIFTPPTNDSDLRFSAKIVKFPTKFKYLNVQNRNNLKNTIFIVCKGCKTCKYYVNSMVILCSTYQKEEKEYPWVKYFIFAVFGGFKIGFTLLVFSPPNLYSQNFRITK